MAQKIFRRPTQQQINTMTPSELEECAQNLGVTLDDLVGTPGLAERVAKIN
jgi:hypothetical protein